MLLIYAFLVASHQGEFWPFSVYPMFSKAGNPWTRAIVIDVTDLNEEEKWNSYSLDDRTSGVVPVRNYSVDQIDFSNFVSKTQNWTDSRREALFRMFMADQIGDREWMVSKVRGEMAGPDSVAIRIIPFIKIIADTTETNPNLSNAEYFREEP